VISALYAAVARRRRERYAARPDLRRRLRRPVISVGNLAVGGRGKTPLVATIVADLLAAGERPSILTRGYGRTGREDGVVVVRDPDGIRADLARAGDEPLMLARRLPGASVLASPDRYLAGLLAERHLGATVHVLDDGFQHLQLERDVDILILAARDVAMPVTLPAGRLREPLDTLIAADAIVAADADVRVETHGLDIPVFRAERSIAPPAGLDPSSAIFVVAGVAEPDRFLSDLRAAGYSWAGSMTFRDHHPYSRRDVARIAAAARAAGAAAVVTTEKDYVRLLPFRPFPVPVGYLPLTMEPEPPLEFRRWLDASIRAARDIIVD
jgi:tetraacyldisaccharide 4'-kinase